MKNLELAGEIDKINKKVKETMDNSEQVISNFSD